MIHKYDAVYPGHPVTLALIITEIYPSFAAAKISVEGAPSAVRNADVPGAGGNVYAALNLLGLLVEKKFTVETALEIGDDTWAKCDDQKEKNPERWKKGQDQADSLKQALLDKLATFR